MFGWFSIGQLLVDVIKKHNLVTKSIFLLWWPSVCSNKLFTKLHYVTINTLKASLMNPCAVYS